MSEFEEFLGFFPELDLPVNISSEYLSVFSSMNKPIPLFLTNLFISDENVDAPGESELENEYIACFKLPEKQNFKAIVYLKISLLNYEYYLHSFDYAGRTISSQIISGLSYDGILLKEKAAMIDENLRVWIMEGANDENNDFDPANSKFLSFYLDDAGQILKT